MSDEQEQRPIPVAREAAEREYLDHAASCSGCAAMKRRCPTADRLWDRYRATEPVHT